MRILKMVLENLFHIFSKIYDFIYFFFEYKNGIYSLTCETSTQFLSRINLQNNYNSIDQIIFLTGFESAII